MLSRKGFDTKSDDSNNPIGIPCAHFEGPRIVAIGGGTGLSVLLSGLKAFSDNLSALVTVADDGGSSGILRRELGLLPPGDFRNCLVAMSDSDSIVKDLFQYRFDQGNGLEGHSFGNIFIAAMANVTGSFESAISESRKLLSVRGQIFPCTLANLSLTAELADGTLVTGESTISGESGPIFRIGIDPSDAVAYPQALEAISKAQLIVIGPGSLYTSVIPNLLVNGISDAIKSSSATKIYVCNVSTQKGETDNHTLSDHLHALQKHTFKEIVDYVITNVNHIQLSPPFLGHPVQNDDVNLNNINLIGRDLVDPSTPVRHDSEKLAQVIMDVYHCNSNNVS